MNLKMVILMTLLTIPITYADVISINSGGSTSLVINPSREVEGFFFQSLGAEVVTIAVEDAVRTGGSSSPSRSMNCSLYNTVNATYNYVNGVCKLEAQPIMLPVVTQIFNRQLPLITLFVSVAFMSSAGLFYAAKKVKRKKKEKVNKLKEQLSVNKEGIVNSGFEREKNG